MNIVYLCANYGLDLDKMLGPKIHIQSILRGLKLAGVNPTLITVQKSDSLKEYEEFETVILPHRYMRGFVHRIIPYTGIIDSLRVFLKIIAINRTRHFALIHERYTGLSWGGVLAAKFLRIPYILQMVGPGIEEKTLQMNPLKPSKRWLSLANQKLLISNNNYLILNSKFIYSFIYNKRGWKLPHYSVILNGSEIPAHITSEEEITIRSLFNAQHKLLLLYSGSLYRWYGTFNLIRAFHLALTHNQDIKLIVIGYGDAEQGISKYISENHLSGFIYLLKPLPHHELQKVIQAVDFCLVYYSGEITYFGSSTKVTEYMAAGKPVISTPHMLEIIDDEVTGFISKTSSIKDFADKIIEVVTNPEQAKTVGENAKAKIMSKFLWKHYIKKLMDIYQSLLNEIE
ncbi:MAG TPA: glycosyltransferase family 4 protein [Candidatus Marinimicrobia bacterium]|nr:glycosyltransferase family 4 protein [Candidatus Neomarinimicrobiota bacterium]